MLALWKINVPLSLSLLPSLPSLPSGGSLPSLISELSASAPMWPDWRPPDWRQIGHPTRLSDWRPPDWRQIGHPAILPDWRHQIGTARSSTMVRPRAIPAQKYFFFKKKQYVFQKNNGRVLFVVWQPPALRPLPRTGFSPEG